MLSIIYLEYTSKKLSALNESFLHENRVSAVLIAVGKTSLLAKICFCYRWSALQND